MKNFIVKRKVLFFLAIVFLLVPTLIFFLSTLFPKKPEPKKITPSTTITPYPTDEETREPIIPVTMVRVFPEENTEQAYFPIQQIEITFSKTIDPFTLVIESEPEVIIKTGLKPSDPNVLIISPDPVWKSGITIIKVSRFSSSGKVVFDRDFVYKINTKVPDAPPLGSPEYEE